MIARRAILIAGAGAVLLGAAVLAAASGGGGLRFPHARHANAFSDCLECHGGVPEGDRSRYYTVTPRKCAECHEPDVVNRVSWDALRRPGGNLRFDHAVHVGADLACANCHREAGETNAMAIRRPLPDGCIACHAASAHLAPDNDCRMCHLPLSEAADWTAERIAAFPAPDGHAEPGFLDRHGEEAERDIDRCAVCHARDGCEACHLEPEGAGAVMRLARDLRVAALVRERGEKPFHGAGFAGEHRAAAAVDKPRCESCHSSNRCSDCHEGQVTPVFHGANYLNRHAAEAWARDTDCATCHSTEVFCRDCHAGAGLSPADALSSAYHDAQPFWLMSHGQAARQGMESCASCHQQTDCLVCHSARGGWRVNPHGSGFDAEAMGDRSPFLCVTCHFTVPEDD